MAGAAVDLGCIRVCGLDLGSLDAGSNTVGEATTRVTTVTTRSGSSVLNYTHAGGHFSTFSVDGRRPSGFLAGEFCGVVMAFGAG